MASVKVVADRDTSDDLIAYWLDIYRTSPSIDVRCKAAERLDQLLRAPVWPTP